MGRDQAVMGDLRIERMKAHKVKKGERRPEEEIKVEASDVRVVISNKVSRKN